MEKEFDWKCEQCDRDIPKSEGYKTVNGKKSCLSCAEETLELEPENAEDVEEKSD